MTVLVRIGAPPGAGEVDSEAVRASLPHGTVTVEVTARRNAGPRNGLGDGGTVCIVNAAIEVGVLYGVPGAVPTAPLGCLEPRDHDCPAQSMPSGHAPVVR